MSTFGSRLRDERARLGFSQQQFAEIGGVKRSSQHLYEHDVRRPDADYLSAIHAAGADVGYLISGRASAVSSVGPMLTVAAAIAAFRAVDDFGRKHAADALPPRERERLFEFLCTTLAAEPVPGGIGDLQERLRSRSAS